MLPEIVSPPLNMLWSRSRSLVILSLVLVSSLFVDASEVDDARRAARLESKPIWLRDLKIGDTTLPFSPVTVLIFVVALYILIRSFLKNSTAEASHILIDDPKKGKEILEKFKREINNDPKKFAEYAAKYSTCPSGKANGGSLGTFGQGSMVPAFDQLVFSPSSPLNTVLGPIQTQFGWHLIYIVSRDEQRQLIVEKHQKLQ